jgi:hypothetical protein
MSTSIFRAAFFLLVACLPAAPALAIADRDSAITYVDEQNERHIWYFATAGRNLVSNHFDGSSWNWADHGQPSRDPEDLWCPRVITYLDTGGKQRIYVFVVTGHGRLKLRYFNGFQWQWVDQGANYVTACSTSAITYVDPAGYRRIYLFGSGTDGHLVTNYWNGSQWSWADNGAPPGSTDDSILTDTITYEDGQGIRKIDVFTRCSVGDHQRQLCVNSWNGSSWSWFNHGGNQVATIDARTFTESTGERRIHVFAHTAGNTPQLHSRIDGSWYWINLGNPLNATAILSGLDSISYTDAAGNRRMQFFATFNDQLWSRTWDGSTWLNWMNHVPPSGPGASDPEGLTYFDPRISKQRIHVFVGGCSGLCDHVYNGSTWQWQDLGSPKP